MIQYSGYGGRSPRMMSSEAGRASGRLSCRSLRGTRDIGVVIGASVDLRSFLGAVFGAVWLTMPFDTNELEKVDMSTSTSSSSSLSNGIRFMSRSRSSFWDCANRFSMLASFFLRSTTLASFVASSRSTRRRTGKAR
ncbi:hypothetical protein C8R46DRAFT_1068722 [Mycena filopes]|nr:hypothetical protein C8R46DRAFT_1068722 [Mycena filopes]